MTEFEQYLQNFRKNPILPQQEAEIIKAMIDGTITKATAKELFRKVVEHNLQKYEEFMSMSEEELRELVDNG